MEETEQSNALSIAAEKVGFSKNSFHKTNIGNWSYKFIYKTTLSKKKNKWVKWINIDQPYKEHANDFETFILNNSEWIILLYKINWK